MSPVEDSAKSGETGMRIPVFVSCPTDLSPGRSAVRAEIISILEDEMLAPRALGRTDYPLTLPLAEVCVIASHCAGGLILGFEQFHVAEGIRKPGVKNEKGGEMLVKPSDNVGFATAWNHMEAAILFALGKPLMLMCESTIRDGVFDRGVASSFTHKLPIDLDELKKHRDEIRQVIKAWRARVHVTYQNVWPFAGRYLA